MRTIQSEYQQGIDDPHHHDGAERASPPAQSKRGRRTARALVMSSLILISVASPPAASTANAAGFLENLLGDLEKGVNSLLGNPGGVLSEIEGVVSTEVTNLGSVLGTLPIVGGLLGHLV
jgi:hypothetical protein